MSKLSNQYFFICQLLYYQQKQSAMNLTEIKANSTLHVNTISSYQIAKVLITGDFLAKDEFDDTFLLSTTDQAYPPLPPLDLQNTNIIQSSQTIEDNNQFYEVFPFDKKLVWGGELVSRKQQIYCLTLLYSAIKHILNPIEQKHLNYEKYITLDNIWIKGKSVYLLLRNKGHPNGNKFFKTENQRYSDRLSLAREGDELKNIRRVGQIFKQMFFKKEDNFMSFSKNEAFKRIVKAMCQGELNLAKLNAIMNDKRQVRKFITKISNSNRRVLYETIELNQSRQQPIDSSPYDKLTTIPINIGRPMHGYLFSNNKRQYRVRDKSDRGKTILFSSLDSDVPPSFQKSSKFKKMSLFGSKPVRVFSHNNRYDVQRQENEENKRLPVANQGVSLNISFANNSTPSKITVPIKEYFKANKKRSLNLRQVFKDVTSNQDVFKSRIDRFNEKSKQKALQKIKQSILNRKESSQIINDEKLQSAVKQKKGKYSKQTEQYFKQAQQLYQRSKIAIQVSETSNTKKFNDWDKTAQNIMTLVDGQIKKHRQESKIQNQELFIDRHAQKKEVSLIEDKLFDEQKQEKFRNVSSSSKKNKNRFDEDYFGQASKNQFAKKQYSLLQQSRLTSNKSSQQQTIKPTIQSKPQPLKPKIQAKPQSVAKVQQRPSQNFNRRSQSEVELVPMSNIIGKLIPNNKIHQEEHKKKEISRQQVKPELIKHESFSQQKVITQQSLKQETPKKIQKKRQNFYDIVQQEIIKEAPSPTQYTYTSKPNKISEPKKQVTQVQKKPLSSLQRPPLSKIVKPKIKSTVANLNNFDDDEIQAINLGAKQEKLPSNKKPSEPIIKNKVQVPTSEVGKEEKANIKSEGRQDSVAGRTKTVQSNASSSAGVRTVRKQIDEYIFMVNKMGEAVAKTAKLNKKLEKVQWYVGVYYLYKRFFHQRKKIERYLQECIPKLTRGNEFATEEWNEWLGKGEREALLAKCRQDNANIQNSLKKMVKKVEAKQLPAKVLINANINKNTPDSTKIAVEYVVDEFDQAVELSLLADPQIRVHLSEMINSLYIIAQLDNKLTEKKNVMELTRTNRTPQELSQMVQVVFDLYEQ